MARGAKPRMKKFLIGLLVVLAGGAAALSLDRDLLREFFLGDTIGVNIASFAWGMNVKMRVTGIAITNEDTPEARLILLPENPREFFPYFKPRK